MKFFYDKQILFKKLEEDKYLVYSSLINQRARVNKSVVDFLKYIMSKKGEVTLSEIKDRFSKVSSKKVSSTEVMKNIDLLKQAKILFEKKSERIEANDKVKNYLNTILNTQKFRTAYLHLTMRCNFKCAYCYNREIESDHKTELDTSAWFRILENLSQAGIKTINITGGEPLLRSDTDLIIKKAKELGFEVALLTNGSLLLDKYDKIVPYIDQLFLSLDSNDVSVNSKNRSEIGFSNILRFIRKMSKNCPEKLTVRSVITKNNIDNVDRFHKFLREKYNIAKLIKNLSIPNKTSEIAEMVPLKRLKKISPEEVEINYKYVICGAGRSTIALAPNGDIYPCQMLMYKELKMSNALNPDWESQTKAAHLDIWPIFLNKNTKCSRCVYKYYCGGGCPGISYKLYKNFTSFLDFLCPYIKEEAKYKIIYKKCEWENII